MVYGIILFVTVIVIMLSILGAIESINTHMKIMSNDINDLYRVVCEMNDELRGLNKR